MNFGTDIIHGKLQTLNIAWVYPCRPNLPNPNPATGLWQYPTSVSVVLKLKLQSRALYNFGCNDAALDDHLLGFGVGEELYIPLEGAVPSCSKVTSKKWLKPYTLFFSCQLCDVCTDQ